MLCGDEEKKTVTKLTFLMVERVAVSCGDGEKDASSRQTREENSDNPQGSLLTNSEVYSSRVFSNV